MHILVIISMSPKLLLTFHLYHPSFGIWLMQLAALSQCFFFFIYYSDISRVPCISNAFVTMRLWVSFFLSFFFFFFTFTNRFYLFIWRLISLQYYIGFAIHWHESTTGVHEPPSHGPPHPIPLGQPSAPALSILSHASNLDWRSISHMIIYMFQCHSPKSSHPHPLPQSPKDYSIHLCLFCCLKYRVIITIFLNSIYMC